MVDSRLVKVAMPAKLVQSMDRVITSSSAYNSRQDFIADAVANLLADIEVASEVGGSADHRQTVDTSIWSRSEREPEPLDIEAENGAHQRLTSAEGLELASIPALPPDLQLSAEPEDSGSLETPTWGLHNRDWPTLWSAALLGKASATGPVQYTEWLAETARLAWQLTDAVGDELDLSGFPSNREKVERSEGRFIEFFVGPGVGRGPLFEFGLACGVGDGRVLLTPDGFSLLRQLEGMRPTTEEPPPSRWRRAFFEHLAKNRPPDLAMLIEVVDLISIGRSTRMELNEALQVRHPDWSDTNAATNAAGYVARAREWGLLERKQINHQYVIRSEALADIEEVARSAGIARVGASEEVQA